MFGKQFDKVSVFSEGLARVSADGKWGFIDTEGQMVVPCVYDFAWDFHDGLARVRSNGKYCVVNKKGECVVQPVATVVKW